MHLDVLQAKWKKFRNEISFHWNQLSSDEIDRVDGRRSNLVVLLQRKYGFARPRAEREVDRVVTEFEDKLRRAA
jgi:uncharacterized protein YjbJ (UPF0337 family)